MLTTDPTTRHNRTESRIQRIVGQKAPERHLGIDVGTETIKIVEVRSSRDRITVARRIIAEHFKNPGDLLGELLSEIDWHSVDSAAATGRGGSLLDLARIPSKAALTRGVREAHGEHEPMTVVSLGCHGFSVLELHPGEHQTYRENSRCSQGTGNFLRQLVERLGLTIEEAGELCAGIEKPAVLSGRCPVILKTDMTHLANKGEDRAAILAGLYDAVCENVQSLIKPDLSPPRFLLVGGLARVGRIRNHFRNFLEGRRKTLLDTDPEEGLYLEALGAALISMERARPVPCLDALFAPRQKEVFEQLPPLSASLHKVRRLRPAPVPDDFSPGAIVLGFDIGSTGAKAVALDAETTDLLWQGYVKTLGNPLRAAQKLAASFLAETEKGRAIRAIGVTGSGREIVGILMRGCFGEEPIFVLNEIAAHAEGALYHDGKVDTIFEIGGQDAKYISLERGRITQAAMNEACSAGTGSFIEEQGDKFEAVTGVEDLSRIAMEAKSGVSLGQHCSVFMAQVIDEAVSANIPRADIVAGIYDSVVQNYLNRVKGNRALGKRLFCQGMPFTSDALAAAVARRTGQTVVVPPNPGTIGALGIGLLTLKEIDVAHRAPLDLSRLLETTLDRRETFTCTSTKGCGKPPNRCRIEKFSTILGGERRDFLWGGNCSLYQSGGIRPPLPDGAPDPFRERRLLIEKLIGSRPEESNRPVVAIADEFSLKEMLPFLAGFIDRLGFDVQIHSAADRGTLKRGIEIAEVPFCAPMQIFLGVVAEMLDGEPDFVLVPRVRELCRTGEETDAATCPVIQGAPDIIGKSFSGVREGKMISPRIDVGPENMESRRFIASARGLARLLGRADRAGAALEAGKRTQQRFDRERKEIGRRALRFARDAGIPAVVVIGHDYTIHNDVLNSNVPNLLRSQGAVAVPLDCYPLSDETPLFEDLYWGCAQAGMRAAHQIRRADGIYAVYCTNYSCGPDSFNLHFFAYAMENKPFAVIETDGHSGDVGTKTRIEAFLYCIDGHERTGRQERAALGQNDFKTIENDKLTPETMTRSRDRLLIPRMGPSSEILGSALRAEGIRAEVLPAPTRETLCVGRRHTSGRECVPMTITAGSLLERLEAERRSAERFMFLMPSARGPCRFGVYNLLHKMILERTGWKERVRVVSPLDSAYFAGISNHFQIRTFAGLVACDLLFDALLDVRPVETEPGLAQAIYDRYHRVIRELVGRPSSGRLSAALGEVSRGLFGLSGIVESAAAEFKAAKDFSRRIPTVVVVGEIYVRLESFANDFLVEKLEERGVRVQVTPITEWLEYTTYLIGQRIRERRGRKTDSKILSQAIRGLQERISTRLHGTMARALGWARRTALDATLHAAKPYLSPEVTGEAVLTLGRSLHDHEQGSVQGVVSVGPHECLPNKIAEAQFVAAARDRNLLTLTLPVNGDPLDVELIDRFVFEIRQRFDAKPVRSMYHERMTRPANRRVDSAHG